MRWGSSGRGGGGGGGVLRHAYADRHHLLDYFNITLTPTVTPTVNAAKLRLITN